MKTPLISVVMPTYNSEKFIAEAIESILAQTVRDFEFLIVNEQGSTDQTIAIAESFQDPRIRVIQNTARLGIAASLNEGILQAKGPYIARMDSDDIALPTRFEKQMAFLEAHRAVSICGTWSEIFGKLTGHNKPQTEPARTKACLLLHTELVHSSLLFRKADLIQNDLWYSSQYLPEDFELFSRAVHRVNIANLPEALTRCRVSGDNVTQNQTARIVSHCQKIIARNLAVLSVAVSQKELRLLSSLRSYVGSESDIRLLHKLCKRITRGNDEKKIYDASALEYVLTRHVYMSLDPFFPHTLSEEMAGVITQTAYDMSQKWPICLFGLGKAFVDLAPYFIARLGGRVHCVSDNTPSHWGQEFCGLPCVPPDRLDPTAIGVVVLATYDHILEILSDLKNKGFSNVRPYFEPTRFASGKREESKWVLR
jgi:glycosyltransferase involved in cell wall biosynthesis